MTDTIREYFSEDNGIIVVGDTVWIRNDNDTYVDKFLILEEYANLYKVQDKENPNALQYYVTKDTFDLVNGDGAVKQDNKDKEGDSMSWLQRLQHRRKKNNTPLKEPVKTTTVASNQPLGSTTGPVKTTSKNITAGSSYVAGAGYGSLYGGGWNNDKFDCHNGNTIVATRSTPRGDKHLMIGGWSRGAYVEDGMVVIDTTGYGKGLKDGGDFWYPFKIKDYDIPIWDEFFWRQLADLVYHHLLERDVLIACQGGHGRSGTVTTVIAGLLQDKADVELIDGKGFFNDPLAWIHKVHCHHAVETYAQEKLVYEVLMHFYPNSVRLAKAWMKLKPPKRVKFKGKTYTKKGDKTHNKKGDKTHTSKYNPSGKCPDCGSWYSSTCSTCNNWDVKKGTHYAWVCLECNKGMLYETTTKCVFCSAPKPIEVGEELTLLDEWIQEEEDWFEEWADKQDETEEGVKLMCPICLTPTKTTSEAVLCCNSKGHNQFCPMCGRWHRTPEKALACCSQFNTGLD